MSFSFSVSQKNQKVAWQADLAVYPALADTKMLSEIRKVFLMISLVALMALKLGLGNQ